MSNTTDAIDNKVLAALMPNGIATMDLANQIPTGWVHHEHLAEVLGDTHNYKENTIVQAINRLDVNQQIRIWFHNVNGNYFRAVTETWAFDDLPNRHLAPENVIINDNIYPRDIREVAQVGIYMENLHNLPHIVVNDDNELIDGWHRLSAMIEDNTPQIEVKVIQTTSDLDSLRRAINMNITNGISFKATDRRRSAKMLRHLDPDISINDLAVLLQVTDRTIRNWFYDPERQGRERLEREERDFEIREQHQAGATQTQLADQYGLSQASISTIINTEPEEIPVVDEDSEFIEEPTEDTTGNTDTGITGGESEFIDEHVVVRQMPDQVEEEATAALTHTVGGGVLAEDTVEGTYEDTPEDNPEDPRADNLNSSVTSVDHQKEITSLAFQLGRYTMATALEAVNPDTVVTSLDIDLALDDFALGVPGFQRIMYNLSTWAYEQQTALP